MILLIILIIVIFLFLRPKQVMLNRIREGETGIATKGNYGIPYVRIRTEIQDMLGV